MDFGIAVDLSDTNLWYMNLLDTDLDLLDTDISSKDIWYLQYLQISTDVSKTSSRCHQDMSSRYLQYIC